VQVVGEASLPLRCVAASLSLRCVAAKVAAAAQFVGETPHIASLSIVVANHCWAAARRIRSCVPNVSIGPSSLSFTRPTPFTP